MLTSPCKKEILYKKPIFCNEYPIECISFTEDFTAPYLTVHGMEAQWQQYVGLFQHWENSLFLDMPWSGNRGYQWILKNINPQNYLQQACAALKENLPPILILHSYATLSYLLNWQQINDLGFKGIVLLAPFYLSPGRALDSHLLQFYTKHYDAFLAQSLLTRSQKSYDANTLAIMVSHIKEKIGPLGCMSTLYLLAQTALIDLSSCQLPILIMGGENDVYCNPKVCHDLSRQLPKAHVEIIQDCGHLAMIEKPQIMRTRIKSFLQAIEETTKC